MDAGKRTINDIFTGNKILEIPFYQRSYVWDKPQWERLLEDVTYVSRTREPYFMGSVILKQQLTSSDAPVGNVRTVVDGQQRLTTISIMLKVLCLKNNTPKKFEKSFLLTDDTPVLKHNHNDVDSYNAIMGLHCLSATDGKDNISRAYQFFMDKLEPDKVDFDVICNQIMFVGIDLTADENEQQIFDTINSLGIRLTTSELLKNYFFGRNDLDAFRSYWMDIFEKDEETRNYWDQEITTGRAKRTLIDVFFFSFLQIKIQDKALNVKTEDKLDFTKVDRLFESYKRFIKVYLNGDKQHLLAEIKEYAQVFRDTFHPDTIDSELPQQAGIERINAIIFFLDTTTLIPYVLFIQHEIQSTETRNSLYSYLESYIMRRLVTRQTTKNYNQLFAERLILNRILSKEALINYLASQDDKINRMPGNDEVKDAFHTVCLTNKYAIGVLYLIESKIRDRHLYSTQLLGINKYSLEHMMPKKWRNHWTLSGDLLDAENRDRKLLTLGNLTVITQPLNASIRDSEWSIKKAGKADKGGLRKYSEGMETLFDFLNLDTWDEAAIEKRANYLAEQALKVWSN